MIDYSYYSTCALNTGYTRYPVVLDCNMKGPLLLICECGNRANCVDRLITEGQEYWTSADAVQADSGNRLPLLRAKIRGGERRRKRQDTYQSVEQQVAFDSAIWQGINGERESASCRLPQFTSKGQSRRQKSIQRWYCHTTATCRLGQRPRPKWSLRRRHSRLAPASQGACPFVSSLLHLALKQRHHFCM